MKEKDFLLVDFVGRIKTTNEIFDLTVEDVAKKENVFDPKAKYEPLLVIIGGQSIIFGVEKQLKEMKTGEEREFDLKPEEAFGKRNPKMIRIVSAAHFIKNKMNPVPGMFYDIDGMKAKVQSVSGGRVRIDFNNPMAGKDVHYWVKIVRQVTNIKEKADFLLKHLGMKFETELLKKTLVLKSDKPVHETITKVIEDSIKNWIPEIEKVEFNPGSKSAGEKKEIIKDG